MVIALGVERVLMDAGLNQGREINIPISRKVDVYGFWEERRTYHPVKILSRPNYTRVMHVKPANYTRVKQIFGPRRGADNRRYRPRPRRSIRGCRPKGSEHIGDMGRWRFTQWGGYGTPCSLKHRHPWRVPLLHIPPLPPCLIPYDSSQQHPCNLCMTK